MKAMLLNRIKDLSRNSEPLDLTDLDKPGAAPGEVLLQVKACGVCHTELDEIEGRTPPSFFPIILGHQIVGEIVEIHDQTASDFSVGDRVGAGWIFSTCGECRYCQSGLENLCSGYRATGRDAHGGYAEFMRASAASIVQIPESFSDAEAAPLLCAGAIGFRSLTLCLIEDGQRLGLTGFGASGHLVLKLAQFLYPRSSVYVFARNPKEREFALELGAVWAGDTTDPVPEMLHAMIDTTPVWKPVVAAMKNLAPGGRLVINAIRKEEADKSELLRLDYVHDLWMEKEIKSVANVALQDIRQFLSVADQAGIRPKVETFKLEEANKALMALKQGRGTGAKVLVVGE